MASRSGLLHCHDPKQMSAFLKNHAPLRVVPIKVPKQLDAVYSDAYNALGEVASCVHNICAFKVGHTALYKEGRRIDFDNVEASALIAGTECLLEEALVNYKSRADKFRVARRSFIDGIDTLIMQTKDGDLTPDEKDSIIMDAQVSRDDALELVFPDVRPDDIDDTFWFYRALIDTNELDLLNIYIAARIKVFKKKSVKPVQHRPSVEMLLRHIERFCN